ncbi:MAG: patatin-like phospholipase family protein [Egibacteraceae bacterium]
MKLALVLSGGGAKGAFEAGVYRAVVEAGLRPSVLSGTSAGALNAAGIAAGFDPERLAAVWTGIDNDDVYRLRRDVWRLVRLRGLVSSGGLAQRLLRSIGWTYLYDTAPLRRTLRSALDGERVVVAEDRVLIVSAVQIASGRLVRFASAAPPEHRRGLARWEVTELDVDHLLASASLPLLFTPGRVDGTAYWDGGVLANTPLAPALAYEPDAAIIVTTATFERPAPEPRSLDEVAGMLIDTVQRFALDADLAHARSINALARAEPQATGKRALPLLLIDPRGLELGDPLDFSRAHARELIARGHEVASEAIAEWREDGSLP